MATSGSKTQAFCSRNGANRYYLKMAWSRTSYSEASNYSVIKVQVFLGSYGNGYNINASATKSGSCTVNGTKYNFTTAGIKLASGGEIKIFEKTGIQIPHNDDGTKTFAMTAYFAPAVTISGSASGTVTIPSTNFTLNTIPRTSSLQVNASFTAGSNKSVTIKRYSSAFTHDLTLKVGGTTIATRTGIGTSTTISFSDAELKTLFTKLAQADSMAATLTCVTKKSGTTIGTVEATGTCTNPAASTSTYSSSVNIGATLSGAITKKNSKFTTRVRLLRSDKSTQITQVQASTWTGTSWSVTVPTSIYSLTPNSNNYTMYLGITTYCATVQTQEERFYAITAKVTGSNPTFNPSSNLTYKDVNSTIVGITGNNQYIVQNKSSLTVTLASGGLATANNSATIKKYICRFANETLEKTHTAGTACVFEFGTTSASSSQNLTIQAVDSRGNSTTVSKTVNVVPYTPPTISSSVTRKGGFTATVPVIGKGTYSKVSVGGANKNTITSVTHKIAVNTGGYGSAASFSSITNNNGTYSTNTYNYTVALTSTAKITITVKDKIGSTVTQEIAISTGLPLFYADSKTGSIGFNKLPTYKSTVEFGLKVDLALNQYWGNGNNSYGMHAGNSDIVAVNSIVFNDSSNNLGEGLRFPNTTYTAASSDGHKAPSNYGDYTTVYFRNQELWCDGSKFMKFKPATIGTNAYTTNTIEFHAGLVHMFVRDIDPTHKNGFCLIDSSDNGYVCHMDSNEIAWTYNNNYSVNYLNAKNHNIQVFENNAQLWAMRCTFDSNATFHGYFQAEAIGKRTTTSAANTYCNSYGTLYRSTSSAKAKLDITPAFNSIDEYKKILNIEPVKWFDKSAMEMNADLMTAEYLGEEFNTDAGIGNMNRVYGCVAEQLEEIGLGCLVDYDDENEEIMGVPYDRIPIMYIPLLKDLYNQVDELKAEIATLKA